MHQSPLWESFQGYSRTESLWNLSMPSFVLLFCLEQLCLKSYIDQMANECMPTRAETANRITASVKSQQMWSEKQMNTESESCLQVSVLWVIIRSSSIHWEGNVISLNTVVLISSVMYLNYSQFDWRLSCSPQSWTPHGLSLMIFLVILVKTHFWSLFTKMCFNINNSQYRKMWM